jgi:fructan beta-fructosidase
MKNFCFVTTILLVMACSSKKTIEQMPYSEQYRPQIHFSPAKNWTNDPNGLVYHEGEYHLFFQYNPYGDTWGHMSWGHAVSNDLIHWKELPVAIQEYTDTTTGDSTMIFSGTVVVDKNNSAGFGANAMVAIYTSHVHQNNQTVVQHQSMAYSTDKGRTWTRYSKNPILDIQRKDFRDPKVFWYEPQQKWVMALVVPDLYKVQFYSSTNLKEWKLMSEFGNAGDRERIWECPDLYELPIENQPTKTQWVLSLSGSHPQGKDFVGMQYFVGNFDGNQFTTTDSTTRYVDYGKDFYAGIVFNNLDKKIMLGWVNNWTYGNQLPTSPWRGAFSLPRELSLQEVAGKLHLAQRPIDLSMLKKEELTDYKNINSPIELWVELTDINSGLKLISAAGDMLTVRIDYAKQLAIDRTKAGHIGFQKQFASLEKSKALANLPAQLHIILDQSIIEIFTTNGETAMSEQFFFHSPQFSIETMGQATIKKGWVLKSIWR